MQSDGKRLRFIKPQEPIPVEVAPISDDWQIKYDGFRTQLVLDWAGAVPSPRPATTGKRYWPIVAALEKSCWPSSTAR
jgi:hypothetical protein